VLRVWLAPPRWAFVFQPSAAAALHLRVPWGQTLCARALQGRRVERWDAVMQASAEATTAGHAQRQPDVWGRRRRQPPCRHAGIGLLPNVA